MERPPATTIIAELKTKSEQIRALALAGYLRTEIRDVLGVRYQHVRKVLLEAGIEAGLQLRADFERSPVTLPDPKPRVHTPSRVLLEAGFQAIAEWISADAGEFVLSAKAPDRPGVYAFIVDDTVMYVGLAQRGFRRRMGHYRRGHYRQRTSARVKGLIASALAQGKRVEIIIAVPEDMQWNGLPINAAAGLETGLIRMIKPEWNLMGVRVDKQVVEH